MLVYVFMSLWVLYYSQSLLFNVLAGPLVTEKYLHVGHTEASETDGMCTIRIIHYDWHSNYVLYIYIYIYIL